jgi:hypothetical protein
MMTFSINIDTPTQTSVINIIGATSVDFSEMLNKLKDNKNKEINPVDLRDSILTLYSTQAFKETKIQHLNLKYIGIDNGNTDYLNKDVKSKIYLGKRSYLDDDLMTDDILNSDSDIILFNTKKDTVSNNRTRLSILSGTNSNFYYKAPYIQSQIVNSGDNLSLSLDLVNVGDINIHSNSGNVYINNIVFPTTASSSSSNITNKTLKFLDGDLIWSDLTYSVSDYVGITGSQLDFYGSTVNVNNYPIEFTSDKPCPISLGDIKMGETFSSVSIF